MFRDMTVVQQIMTELNGAVTKEENVVATTKMVIKPLTPNGQ
jgi:hypothetical protein